MDTVVRIFKRKAWNSAVFFGTLCVVAPAWAGTVLLAPQPTKAANVREEVYPESRFGQPPMRVDIGVASGYAARETQDMDEGDEFGPREFARAPAGLVVGQQPALSGEQGESAGHRFRAAETAILSDPISARSAEANALVSSRKGVQEVAIIANDLGYFPKTVFVTRDIPVRLFVTGASRNTLCIMMDSFQVRKQVRSQKIEEITFTPNEPGKYRFYCPVNGMEGTLIVKELVSSVQQ